LIMELKPESDFIFTSLFLYYLQSLKQAGVLETYTAETKRRNIQM